MWHVGVLLLVDSLARGSLLHLRLLLLLSSRLLNNRHFQLRWFLDESALSLISFANLVFLVKCLFDHAEDLLLQLVGVGELGLIGFLFIFFFLEILLDHFQGCHVLVLVNFSDGLVSLVLCLNLLSWHGLSITLVGTGSKLNACLLR